MLFALQLSFTSWHGSGQPQFIGLGNYAYLLSSPDFWSSLGNSGIEWLLIVPIQAVGALALAAALSRSALRFKGALRTAVILPFVTPLVAMAQAWVLIFDQNNGAVNALFNLVGLPSVGWLTTTTWAKPTIAMLVIWKTFGFALIIMLAAVQSIPDEVYDAASMDGAGTTRKFFSITVPLTAPALAFFVVMSTLGISQMFAEPYLVTKGGPYNSSTTSGLYLFNHIGNSDLGTGSANSFLLVILVLLLALVAIRALRSRES